MNVVAEVYLVDASGYRGHADRVLTPSTEEEVLAILREVSREKIPLTVTGARTGLAGGGIAEGGWMLSLEKFRKCEIRQGAAVVGPAVLLRDLQAAARPSGQFYAPDPTENTASIGGAIATNASGSRSFMYGAVRRHLLGLRVALLDGRVLDVKRGDAIDFAVTDIPLPNTTKYSAGFPLRNGMDWVDLFCGSEGTLGVVLEATVQLLPLPGELFAGVIFFPEEDAALDAVDAWRPVPGLRMLEFFDGDSLRLLGEKHGAALLIEQEIQDDQEEERWIERLESAGARVDASWFAAGDRDRERFRQFRHSLPEKVNATVRQHGLQKLGSDFAVPLDRNREMMRIYRALLKARFPGPHVIFGHIGDAHVHVNLLPRTEEESAIGKELMYEFAGEAVRLGGAVAAEHGLGKRKARFLALQFNADQIEAMRAVKRRFDPDALLGRGTLFP